MPTTACAGAERSAARRVAEPALADQTRRGTSAAIPDGHNPAPPPSLASPCRILVSFFSDAPAAIELAAPAFAQLSPPVKLLRPLANVSERGPEYGV